MAIDTRDKRGSTIQHSQAWAPLFPNPDGAIAAQADRQHIGLVYRGVLAGGAPSFQVAWARNANTMIQRAL